MKVAYINPFIVATRRVFETMVHVPLAIGKPYLRAPDDQLFRLYQVSATIGLSGPVLGIVVLNLSEAVALAMAGGLTGSATKELDPDTFDALAEITNMIAGNAKKDLPGGLCTLSVPTLLPTPDVIYPRNCPVIAIPVDTSVGRFVMETALREVAVASAA